MSIIKEDLNRIYMSLTEIEKNKLREQKILITGFAGSLGYMLCKFFCEYGEILNVKKVYCIDNYIFGKPDWINDIAKCNLFEIKEADIISCDLEFAKDASLIFHMASLASPVYYRLHPIETMDADVIGLRRLLEYYEDKNIYNLLFFSTSEIYGNPAVDMVPTSEEYFGNVNTSGPRACYDESKRFGETICYNFNRERNINVTVVRPFNSFGPGLRTNDKRVMADFAKNVLDNEDITIYSDGKPTRTFCYSTDTTSMILKCALYGKYEIFNVGMDKQEINIFELAKIFKKVGEEYFNFNKDIVYKVHEDKHYNTDNPQRRCPSIKKMQTILGYTPQISLEEGIKRYLTHIEETK